MKEKIERFSNGEFEYELPFLCLSEEEIRITVESGKVFEGCFTISNSLQRQMEGVIYSSSRLLQLENPSFCGDTCTVVYSFNAAFLKMGETIHGEITVVSDCGEKTIPFYIQVEQSYYMTTLGKIKDLFQFANLARADWSEAKKIFRSDDFERIFLSNEDRYRFVYRGLLKSLSTSQAMEEFLITIHKKAAIRFAVDKTRVEHLVTEEGLSDKLILTKEHWGHAELKVSTDASFIQLEQKFLWADRFVDNMHPVSYTIDPKQLRTGNNYGHIWIKTVYQTIEVQVTCKWNKKNGQVISNQRLYQKLEFGLTDNYLGFRLNQIDLIHFLEEAEGMMKELPESDQSNIKKLLMTHMAIISGKNQIAEELLKEFTEKEERLKEQSILEYCGYLYLKALYYKDEPTIKEAAGIIRYVYETEVFDWRLLWLLLYTDQQYENNKGLKLTDIKAQYEAGCRSPILYYEAVCIYNEEPVLLRELSDFEIQVINFGIKNWFLTKEVTQQYTYLTGKRKTFHPVIYQGLVKLYDEYDTPEILSAICCLLIKGMKKSEKYFEWYQRGVDSQLRITELYEYYMYSVSCYRQEPLAQSVLLYFIYNSSLTDTKKAFLYANIIKYKDKNDTVYRGYSKKMEIFAAKMLEAHIVNRDLAILYKEFFDKNLLSPQLMKHMPYVIYRHEFVCDNPNMTNVIIMHKELGTGENLPLAQGHVQIDIFSGNAEIFLADSAGNRYIESVDYTISPFLTSEDYEIRCLEYSRHIMLLLHLFDRYQSYRVMSDSAIDLRKQILQIDGLTQEYITECYQSLIEYYYEKYNDDLLEFFLNQINLSSIRPSERMKYIEYMVIRAYYNKALRAFETFGFDEMNINRLVKLCSGYMLIPEAEHKQEIMVRLCYYVFSHGKYDEAILRYLVKFYDGATNEMFQLWQAAKNFELSTYILEERILTQMLFTQCLSEESFRIFKEYYKNIANKTLVRAFLSFYAYQYLLHDRNVHPELFLIMKRELNYEENDLCLVAWLKNNLGNHQLTENELTFIEYHIERFVKKGMILPFFAQYKNMISLPKQMLNKYYITYRTAPGKQVFLRYRLRKEGDSNFITERMTNVYMGLHVKEFVLYYHEVLQYYISEEAPEGSINTECTEVQYDCELTGEEDMKYHQINRMLMTLEMQEEDSLLDMMEDYCKKEYMINACFKQIM